MTTASLGNNGVINIAQILRLARETAPLMECHLLIGEIPMEFIKFLMESI